MPLTFPEPLLHWLFLDLNSYFASVEQELRPELRGKPIVVVPVMADTSVAIAASYEAKACGIRTGTQIGEARRMCQDLQLVEARHEVYVQYHNRVVEAIESCIPVAAVMSIDEMACRLIGRERPLMAALDLAKRVKQTVRAGAGATLRCSVGLAPNRYLAKIASDMEKPDGLTALTKDMLPEALLRLTPRDLPGVGARMQHRLEEQGIRTMAHVLKLSREQMGDAWGSVGGERLWHWLRGEDFNDEALEHPKSIGHSHVLGPDLRTIQGTYAVAHKLLHKSAMRLRRARMWATHISLIIKFAVDKSMAEKEHTSGIPQKSWTQGMRILECQDTQTLIEGLTRLWEQRPRGRMYEKPFFVGVQLTDLVPDALHTLSLLPELAEGGERSRLASAMDALNTKYGTETLYFASMQLARAAAPTRIAFTAIPDLF